MFAILNDRWDVLKLAVSISVAILLFSAGVYVIPNTPMRRILKLLLLLVFAIIMGNGASMLNLGYRPIPWTMTIGLGLLMLFCYICMSPEKIIRKKIEQNIKSQFFGSNKKDEKK